MLAIPTRRIAGIEDPEMLAPDALKVFAEGWKAKAFVEARLGHPLPREAVALALNSEWARTQEQLRVHIDCVSKNVAAALADYGRTLDNSWRAMTVALNGRVYFPRRLNSADLTGAQPLRLLADGIDGAKTQMGTYSIAAVGATFDGDPGFILLADRFFARGRRPRRGH
jgi:CDP-diacylglycerol pyrophosphatase